MVYLNTSFGYMGTLGFCTLHIIFISKRKLKYLRLFITVNADPLRKN